MQSQTALINQFVVGSSVTEQMENAHQRFGNLKSLDRHSHFLSQTSVPQNMPPSIDVQQIRQNLLLDEINKYKSQDH